MKLLEGRTPYFLGSVCHSFILDILQNCSFPQGRFCPDLASGVEQGLASFYHGLSCLYLETNKRFLGNIFTGPDHIELDGGWVCFGRSGRCHTLMKQARRERRRQFRGSARQSGGQSLE